MIGNDVMWKVAQRIVIDEAGCWLWQGSKDPRGYGRMSVLVDPTPGRRRWRLRGAHRVVFAAMVGPLIEGLEIDHLCRVRSCVNPAHLRQVTHAVNTLASPINVAAVNKAKTHCANGHEFTPENTITRSPSGHRKCRTCHNACITRRRIAERVAASNPVRRGA